MTKVVGLPCDVEPFEYFCFGCGQLRLCCDPKLKGCKNCGTPFTHKSKPGKLDGKKLKADFLTTQRESA
jgi:hypothetical protein